MRRLRSVCIVITGLLTLFFILNLIFPLRTEVSFSQLIFSADSVLMHAYLSDDDKWRMKTELNEITPDLQKAIISKEDRFFFFHPGINPVSILRAIYYNTIKGYRTSGASTITMQVARLLEPKRRTYGNKLIEMFRALQLEWKFSKREILQFYLNLVPYGGNIEGVKSASVLYFNKMPDHLSIGEIAALSVIPNRPNSLRPDLQSDSLIKARNYWLDVYKDKNLFSKEAIEEAYMEPIDGIRHYVPDYAPHFSNLMHKKYPGRTSVYSHINLEYQDRIEKITRHHVNSLRYRNINNATVLVIDNSSGKIISYVGSSDFYNSTDGGQVDGIQAVRSPGSTLKPVLYGLAFDKGVITPMSVLTDVPASYYGYEPENYDGVFNGNVTAKYALAHSLNVPAVKILAMIESRDFKDLLVRSKFQSIENQYDYLGLSVILGGCGVTAFELASLYSGIANGGVFRDISLSDTDTSTFTTRILSESAAFMVTDILTMVERPDLPDDWQNSPNLPKIAWKTGTSYGRKDAWSIGYNRNYTISVWVGNFSGEGVPELSGVSVAAPLLFKVFNAVQNKYEENWFFAPEELQARFVCSESGLPPNEYCTNEVIDYYIPGISASTECQHLKRVHISDDSSLSYCRSCLPEHGFIETYFVNYQPEIISWMDQNMIPYQRIPPHNPDCERLFKENNPRITSPVANNEYYLLKNDTLQLKLSCQVAQNVQNVFWYVNDKFLKTADAKDELFITPPEGKVKVSCSDDKGRNTDIFFEVKFVEF